MIKTLTVRFQLTSYMLRIMCLTHCTTADIWASTRENLSLVVCEQPRRSLISTFVIRLVESLICKLATGEISIFQLVSIAEETGLKLAVSENTKTGFLARRPI